MDSSSQNNNLDDTFDQIFDQHFDVEQLKADLVEHIWRKFGRDEDNN